MAPLTRQPVCPGTCGARPRLWVRGVKIEDPDVLPWKKAEDGVAIDDRLEWRSSVAARVATPDLHLV